MQAADQRQELLGRMKSRVGITSLAVDPLQPHLFLTGGSDALGEHPLARLPDQGRICPPSMHAHARPAAHCFWLRSA